MKILTLLVFVTFIMLPFSCIKDTYSSNFFATTSKITTPPPGYERIWSDEFNGDSLDFSKWGYRGLGRRGDGYLTKDAIKLDDKGHLLILTYVQKDTVFSGMISTQGKFESKYGYFECKAKLNKFNGHYPAFWLQSPKMNNPIDSERHLDSIASYNGAEIDIFEYFNHGKNNRFVSHQVFYGGYGPNIRQVGPWTGWAPRLEKGYHTFGLEWTPEKYIFNIDGHVTWEAKKGVSQIPEYIILSDIIGLDKGDSLRKYNIKDTFSVDYVRIYKKMQ